MLQKKSFDKFFVIIVTILILFGFFLFLSASLGLLAKESGAQFSSTFFNQLIFGLVLGLLVLFIFSKIHYLNYKKYTFYLFLFSLAISLLVFVPGLGFEYNGAHRWLILLGMSFQPAELLKFSFVLYFATLLSSFKNKFNDWKYSVLPLLILLAIVSGIAFLQPDLGTFAIIAVTAMAMFFASGVRFKYIGVTLLTAVIGLIPILYSKDYILKRFIIFFNPDVDILGDGYQIKQSLIAIGSGGFWGNGFGKSIQKFGSLPEAIGDSIFAVTAEEWGFLGASFLIILFFLFTYRGLKIASHTADSFGGLLVVGLVILIASQSFVNMGSMLGIFPVIGMPLLFVSKGGTALLFTLAEVGIILNVSKYQKLKNNFKK